MKTERQKQQEYLAWLEAEGQAPDLVHGEQFIAGMRKLGYRDTGHALDELIDNSLEAGATKTLVLFGYSGKTNAKPTDIAIVDNGLGMPKGMLQSAVVWGGTHRHNSRDFFGRFGFGLPSASMSIGQRFEVYSRQDGGPWYMVPIDLEEIVSGDPVYRGPDGRIVPPAPVEALPPAWVVADSAASIDLERVEAGTVVVIRKIDNLTKATAMALQTFLLAHFGTIYRNFIDRMKIEVNGTAVEAIDPLFVTPTARYYDIGNGKFAEPLPELRIPVRYQRDGLQGSEEIVCRFAYLPYGFMKTSDNKDHGGRKNAMTDGLGIIFMRQGRQIEVVRSRCPWTKFQNNDMYCRVEVDFPASLDEFFDVPTNKQQVVPSEHIWESLNKAGVYRALYDMRKRYKQEADEHKAKEEHEGAQEGPTPAEAAMAEVAKTLTKRPPTPKRQKESDDLLSRRAREKAMREQIEVEEALDLVQAESESRPYLVVYESKPEGPFYTCRQVGGRLELEINTAHRFFSDVYSAPGSNRRTRAGLEALLFVLAVRELEAGEDLEGIYQQERIHWSATFARVLKALESRFDSLDDARNVDAQMAEDEAEPTALAEPIG